MEYKGNKEKLEYFDKEKNDLCLIEENKYSSIERIYYQKMVSKRYLKPKRLL